MTELHVSDAIRYVGVDDTTIDLFESQYPVPNGVSYNSYVILDEKVAVMDTVDRRAAPDWLENLEAELKGRAPDYLVIQHLEPDHAGSIGLLAERYPNMTLVGNAKTFSMLPKFFPALAAAPALTVKEGDTLPLGSHTLTFVMAPMVHWPEVMVSYESCEKILFSADGFGTFGALSAGQSWEKEAARYYFNIVGKYGAQVQALLKKAAGLDIRTICPLHGPVLRENLGFYLDKYDRWSRYEPEEKDAVLVAFATIHGNTAQAAGKMKEILERRGCGRVALVDLCREDQAVAVEEAFRCGRLVAMSPTYDGGLFPAMDHFMAHLRDKTYRSRTVALIENGSWAPSAAKHMRAYLEAMKDVTICPTVHTIQGAVKEADVAAMERIADEVLA
ncbi:MAG: FprA family A-type flavoprotein [Oscillospiraceae bacterium]|jgi:flavorubredoxin|nr:FprA family A-type flavoprotein [Oscillospiraceae bacterium]MCI9562412.1 FprA family A-type flavoprotein [Oscillospiraceae bacterium]